MANKASVRIDMNILVNAIAACGIEIQIESYSPGDGWTRYSVSYTVTDASFDRHPVLANSLNARECLSYLQGIYDAKRFKL